MTRLVVWVKERLGEAQLEGGAELTNAGTLCRIPGDLHLIFFYLRKILECDKELPMLLMWEALWCDHW